MNKYQKEYAKFLNNFLIPQKPLKVVFDCSNGTTAEIIKEIADYGLRIRNAKNKIRNTEFVIINSDINGNFPAHGPNPLEKGAMDQIKKSVLENKADLGVIFDADGDRAFFVDEKGRNIDPDVIAYLLISYLKSEKIIVTEVTSDTIAKSQISNLKSQIIRSENGGYAIKKAMLKNKADFGCERSGHYYFAIRSFSGGGFFYMDSGILAAINVINAISKLPYKISDFADLSPIYFRSGDINIGIWNMENGKWNRKQFENYVFKKIMKYFHSQNSRFKILNSSHIDGLRMDFDGWWFNMQLSNTEPIVRLNLESSDKDMLAKQAKILIGLVRKLM